MILNDFLAIHGNGFSTTLGIIFKPIHNLNFGISYESKKSIKLKKLEIYKSNTQEINKNSNPMTPEISELKYQSKDKYQISKKSVFFEVINQIESKETLNKERNIT